MRISTRYDIGQTVYVVHDIEQLARMVVGITIRPGAVFYSLCNGDNSGDFYEIELSDVVDVVKKVG